MSVFIENSQETRMVVRIRLGYDQVYFKNDMTREFFERWQWFFEYKAALIKVNNPKTNVKYEVGTYIYELPEPLYFKKLVNLIRAKITEFENKFANAIKNWDEIFPIEEHPYWARITQKQKKLNFELNSLLNELSLFEQYKTKEQKKTCINPEIETGF